MAYGASFSVETKKRDITNKLTDVENPILLHQFGKAKSRLNTAFAFLPHNIDDPKMCSVIIDNAVGAFDVLSAPIAPNIADLRLAKASVAAYADATAYTVGEIVYDSVNDDLYQCTTAGTSSGASAGVSTGAVFTRLYCNYAVKITLTATSAKDVAFFYKVEGY